MARRRLDRRLAELIGVALGLAGAAGCAAPPPPPDAITIEDLFAARGLAGDWEWAYVTFEDGTARRERERWHLEPTADGHVLTGRYTRDVAVRALDDLPFVCAQRPRYALHAEHEVRARLAGGGAVIEELGYQVTPSPCDPGLRQRTTYRARLGRDRLVLRWDGGEATLRRPAPDAPAPPPAPVTAPAPAGRWTWHVASYTRAGLVQVEDEDWELALADDGTLAGTYLRTIDVRTPDGSPQACAGGPGYRVVDRYLVRGRRDPEGDGWRLEEVGHDPGVHPCLAATPTRTIDAATVDVEGDYLVLTWRGKRRQVLGRAGL